MEANPPSAQTVSLAPVAWAAAQLSVAFVLDVSSLSRGDGDLLQPLLLTAILEANQAELRKDAALQQLYGDEASALPDALRRPISINATAQSLGLPFETVRRRAQQLQQAGLCVVGAQGLYVPQSVVTSPAYLAVQAARVERLARFQRDLAVARVLPAEVQRTLAHGRVRALDRALGEYMLRVSDPVMRLAGSAMNGLTLLSLCAEQTAHLAGADWRELTPSYRANARPRALTDLSARLRMPRETVRRHLLALAEHGLARREGRGWSACADAAATAQLGEIVEGNLVNLRRLFARVEALAQEPPGAGAPAAQAG